MLNTLILDKFSTCYQLIISEASVIDRKTITSGPHNPSIRNPLGQDQRDGIQAGDTPY